MVSIELEDKEVLAIIDLIGSSTIVISKAEEALQLLNKFKEAANASEE